MQPLHQAPAGREIETDKLIRLAIEPKALRNPDDPPKTCTTITKQIDMKRPVL
jgi:hypothetical protein